VSIIAIPILVKYNTTESMVKRIIKSFQSSLSIKRLGSKILNTEDSIQHFGTHIADLCVTKFVSVYDLRH